MTDPDDRTLEAALRRLSDISVHETPNPDGGLYNTSFDRLAGAVRALDQSAASDRVRPDRLEEARSRWTAARSGGRAIDRPTALTLCWDPPIASQAEFCRVLDEVASPLRGRAIRGLVATYHETWPAGDPHLSALIRRSIARLPRSRGPVGLWSHRLTELVGTGAPENLASTCERSTLCASEELASLSLSVTTPFARQVANDLAERLSNAPPGSDALRSLVNEILPADNDLIGPRSWGKVFARLVDLASTSTNADVRQRTIDLALKTRKLPDPRMSPDDWTNVPKKTRQNVMRWLSEEDLRFFFDLLMQDRKDPQGRYDFWIQYASRALRSSVVVGSKDLRRLRRELQQLTERGRTFAEMTGAGGANAHVSAFIMDFGKATVVEFSQPNSACYVYTDNDEDLYLDLSSSQFGWKQLKNTARADFYAHRGAWQQKFRGILAEYGIRPERN